MPLPTAAPRRALVAAAVLALLVSVLAGCGSDDDPEAEVGAGGGSTATAQSDDPYGDRGSDSGATGTAGTIVAEDFSLTDLTVAPGEEIVLQNDGAAPHTATADEGAFDLGEVGPGETSEPGAAPTEAGSYPFHCEIHPDMTATLTVEG